MEPSAEPQASAERSMILQQIKDKINGVSIPPLGWAFSCVGDIEMLRTLAAKGAVELNIIFTASTLKDIASLWTQTSRPVSPAISETSSPSASPQPSSSKKRKLTGQTISPSPATAEIPRSIPAINRSKFERDKCLQRDQRCLLTRCTLPEVAHIFPFSALKKPLSAADSLTWRTLSLFFREEDVNAWLKVVLPGGVGVPGVETCKNLLCLSPTAHVYHKNAFFGLRPIPPRPLLEAHEMELEFVWLPSYDKRPAVDITEQPRQSTAGDTWGGPDVSMGNEGTHEWLATGDIIKICTDDHVQRPLPSFDLLDMQWKLQQVMALSAAGKDDNDDNDDDQADEYEYEYETEVESLDLNAVSQKLGEALKGPRDVPGLPFEGPTSTAPSVH